MGGPALFSPLPPAEPGALLLSQPEVGSLQTAQSNESSINQPLSGHLAFLENGLLASESDSSAIGGNGTLVTYNVRKGDSLSKIAANFGISTQTIIGLNPEVKNRALRVGQELHILPVSGVLYVARDGETIESIADTFNVTVAQIRDFNRNIDLASLQGGTTIVIPGASAKETSIIGGQVLANLKGYFVKPTDGFN